MELVLNNYGIKLSISNNAFIVTNEEGKHRIPIRDVDTIIVCKNASLTSNAILLAIDNNIQILFYDYEGIPKGRIWSNQYGSISTIRKGQLSFCQSKQAVDWIKGMLVRKIRNQLVYIDYLSRKFKIQIDNNTLRSMNKCISKILELHCDNIRQIAAFLRGNEGYASKKYFMILNEFIPENLRFPCRTQHPARDPVNAFLNYGYGILYHEVENNLIKTGLDPYIGVFHRDEYNRPSLVYDFIEPYRIWIDHIVYSLAISGLITDECCDFQETGCILDAPGRQILLKETNEYLSSCPRQSERGNSRRFEMFLEIQQFAQNMKKQI